MKLKTIFLIFWNCSICVVIVVFTETEIFCKYTKNNREILIFYKLFLALFLKK